MKNKISIKDQIFNSVADTLEIQLKKHGLKWSKNWVENSTTQDLNIISKKPYNGFNTFLLFGSRMQNAYKYPFWLTFNQAKDLKFKILKGSKSTLIGYYEVKEQVYNESKHKKYKTISNTYLKNGVLYIKLFIQKKSNVFNIQQTTIMNDQKTLDKYINKFIKKEKESLINTDQDYTEIQNIIYNLAIVNHEKSGGCFYSPLHDQITMIEKNQFNSNSDYTSVLFHELAHWTKTEKRTNREKLKLPYSNEELVAEITSVFLSIYYGVELFPRENHTAYIQSWLKSCKDKKKSIYQAFQLAKKSSQFITEKIDIKLNKIITSETKEKIKKQLTN